MIFPNILPSNNNCAIADYVKNTFGADYAFTPDPCSVDLDANGYVFRVYETVSGDQITPQDSDLIWKQANGVDYIGRESILDFHTATYFKHASPFITIPSDFYLSFWNYSPTAAGSRSVFSAGQPGISSTRMVFIIDNNNSRNTSAYWNSTGSVSIGQNGLNGTYSDGAWHYYELFRQSGVVSYQIDEVLIGTRSFANNMFIIAPNFGVHTQDVIFRDGAFVPSEITGLKNILNNKYGTL